MQRFMMRLDPAWRPLFWPFGAAQPSSFVEVEEAKVRFKFGYLFDRSVQREEIESAYRRDWPWWMGIGWRSNLRGVIGLIGSTRGVVEVQLRGKTRSWGVFPCDRIAVSVQDPDGFIAALSQQTEAAKSDREKTRSPASMRVSQKGKTSGQGARGTPGGRTSSRKSKKTSR
jgi:hypothetical protein